MILTDEQRGVLRHLGGWPIADALLDPTIGCKHLADSHWGGTSCGINGAHFQCERDRIDVYNFDTFGVPDDVGLSDRIEKRVLFSIRYSDIRRYAAVLAADVCDELRAARDHHRRLHLSWSLRGEAPPGKSPTPPTQAEWDAHLADWRPAVERLAGAVKAALPARVAEPRQLGLFEAAIA